MNLMRPQVMAKLAFASALALVACAPDSQPERPAYAFRGATMGTYYSVKVTTAEELSSDRLGHLQTVIERELDDVNAKMSTWIPHSEISRFNRHRGDLPFAVSPSTFEVFAAALEIWKLSGGAYDVTAGPLINAWGFGPQGEAPGLDSRQIAELMEQIGFDQLELDATSNTLRKVRANLYSDLSSIAKGYAVDRIMELLMSEGLGDAWVEVGGEVRANGRNADRQVWRLGIERPQDAQGALQRIVPLDGAAVATSGDYRNYRERDGTRFSHIIDPRDGWPIRHDLASVSVVHPLCMTADALATALMVMGPGEGWDLAMREGLAVLMLIRDGDDFIERMTPAFEALIQPVGKPRRP